MAIWKNKKGKIYQTGIHGTYPVCDNDPQNFVEDFDEDDFTDKEIYFDDEY